MNRIRNGFDQCCEHFLNQFSNCFQLFLAVFHFQHIYPCLVCALYSGLRVIQNFGILSSVLQCRINQFVYHPLARQVDAFYLWLVVTVNPRLQVMFVDVFYRCFNSFDSYTTHWPVHAQCAQPPHTHYKFDFLPLTRNPGAVIFLCFYRWKDCGHLLIDRNSVLIAINWPPMWSIASSPIQPANAEMIANFNVQCNNNEMICIQSFYVINFN